jgi:aminomethyltransferase
LDPEGVIVTDLRETHGYLGILGPLAREVLIRAAGDDVLGLRLLSFEHNDRLRATLFHVGYAGEFEYRLLGAVSELEASRRALERAGESFGMVAGGRATLATLMLEVRSLLSNDVPADANVLEAGLHWMIDFDKPALMAGDALNSLKLSLRRRGVMIALTDIGRAKAGDLLSIDGSDVGTIARIAHSPLLNRDIGFAYVDAEIAWVGVPFDVGVGNGSTTARAISAPVLRTRSALGGICLDAYARSRHISRGGPPRPLSSIEPTADFDTAAALLGIQRRQRRRGLRHARYPTIGIARRRSDAAARSCLIVAAYPHRTTDGVRGLVSRHRL